MKKQNKIIGILGGMGPQASAKLVRLLVDLSAKEFGAINCEDFPEIILDSIPIPDFIAEQQACLISDKKNKKIALKILQDRVKRMNKIGVNVLAISCNTAHLLLNELQSVSNVPFISMVDEVAKKIENTEIKRIGLLASPTTIKEGLFQKAIGSKVEFICPSKVQLKVLEAVIRRVISGKIKKSDKLKLIEIALSLKHREAEGVILGCTELPLIFPKRFEILIFDSLEILARALLKAHFKEGRNTL